MAAETQKDLVVIDRRSSSLEPEPVLSPMQELQMMIVRTGDLEKLKELRAIEKEWRADQAKQQFEEAMAAFAEEPEVVRIVKDKKNAQYNNSPYVSLGREASVIVPLLSKHGLTGRWNISQADKGGITVAYVLRHRAGHSDEPVSITLPPDASGSKNAAQQVKSAITYGRIITMECACGIAPIDSNASLNDDGNGTGEPMIEAEVVKYLDWIKDAKDDAELQKYYLCALKLAEEAKDGSAKNAFSKAKNERYRQLHPRGNYAGR